MKNFTFINDTKYVFGKGTHLEVGKEIKQYGKRVLIHYGGDFIKETGLFDEIAESLDEAGIEYFELSGVEPNPKLSLVKEGIELCKQHDLDFVLAIGGGSAIDSAKAIGVGALYDGDVWDFYINEATPTESLPVGVILTIASAGSEGSGGSIITNEDGLYKRVLDSDLIRPTLAILNPELTYTLPQYQTMCGVADMMSHAMERYFTNTKDVDLTDRLCEATMRAIINNGRVLIENPTDYAARAEIMWAGTLAQNGLLGTGRIEDWGAHMIEHEVSGIYDVIHGAGMAAIFPSWMRYVMNENLDKFVQFAVRVWDVDLAYDKKEAIALEGIRRYESFMKEIGLPTSLSELNVPDDRLEEMAEKSVEFGSIGNLKVLNKEDVLNILKMSL